MPHLNAIMGKKWSSQDIPDLQGQVAVITGANSGLGLASAQALAVHKAEVVLICRSQEKAEAAMHYIEQSAPEAVLYPIACDLGDLEQVRKAASQLVKRYSGVNILMNNAGVMAPPYSTTKQGFELQWGVNYLAHFYLTGLLWPILEKGEARVVQVSSLAALKAQIHWDDANFSKQYDAWKAYGQSKIAPLMLAMSLAERYPESKVKSMAAHPGFSATNLFVHLERKMPQPVFWALKNSLFKWMIQSAEMGALPQLYAATSPQAETGGYYGPSGSKERKGFPGLAKVPQAAEYREDRDRLWSLTEQELNYQFGANTR